MGEPHNLACLQVLDVEITFPHVSDAATIGSELREHQRGGFCVGAAQLLQCASRALEHPVISARVVTPDFFAVGKDQELAGIVRPDVILDVERRARPGWNQLIRSDQHRALTARRVVAHDLTGIAHGLGFFNGCISAVAQPARGSEAVACEVAAGKNPAQLLIRATLTRSTTPHHSEQANRYRLDTVEPPRANNRDHPAILLLEPGSRCTLTSTQQVSHPPGSGRTNIRIVTSKFPTRLTHGSYDCARGSNPACCRLARLEGPFLPAVAPLDRHHGRAAPDLRGSDG